MDRLGWLVGLLGAPEALVLGLVVSLMAVLAFLAWVVSNEDRANRLTRVLHPPSRPGKPRKKGR